MPRSRPIRCKFRETRFPLQSGLFSRINPICNQFSPENKTPPLDRGGFSNFLRISAPAAFCKHSYNENDTPVFGELACGRFLRHPIFVLCGGESETYLVPGAKNMGQAIYDVDRFYAPSWAWFNHRPTDPA